MEECKKKITYNFGKVEFIAALDLIEGLAKQGHTKSYIYRILRDDGKYTMSYDTFRYHMKKFEIQISKAKSEQHQKEEMLFYRKEESQHRSQLDKRAFIRPKDMADKPLI